ncbi:MAG: CvpA family protein [Patescibacteria group bacterium]
MAFTIVDVILIVIVLIFALVGFASGLVQAVGTIIGIFVGAWVASHYFVLLGDWLTPIVLGHALVAKIIAFIILFILVSRLIGLIFHLLDKAFKIISIIPFLKSINRLGGMLLGLVEGALVVGLIVYVIAKLAPDWTWVKNDLNGSQIAHYLVWVAKVLTDQLPQAFAKIKSIF